MAPPRHRQICERSLTTPAAITMPTRPASAEPKHVFRYATLNTSEPCLQLLGGFAGRIGPKRRTAPTFPQVGDLNDEQPPPKTAQKPRTHGKIGARFLRNRPEPAGEAAAAASADAGATRGIAANTTPSPVHLPVSRLSTALITSPPLAQGITVIPEQQVRFLDSAPLPVQNLEFLAKVESSNISLHSDAVGRRDRLLKPAHQTLR